MDYLGLLEGVSYKILTGERHGKTGGGQCVECVKAVAQSLGIDLPVGAAFSEYLKFEDKALTEAYKGMNVEDLDTLPPGAIVVTANPDQVNISDAEYTNIMDNGSNGHHVEIVGNKDGKNTFLSNHSAQGLSHALHNPTEAGQFHGKRVVLKVLLPKYNLGNSTSQIA